MQAHRCTHTHTHTHTHSSPHPPGAYAGLRASGVKADLALVVADSDAVVGGTFTQNVVCAAPVLYCKDIMAKKKTIRAVSTAVDC